MTVFYDVKHRYMQEDTLPLQSPMETVTLILPLEVTTMNNPSNSTRDSWSDSWSDSRRAGRVRWSHRLSYDRSILEYKVINFPP